MVVLAILKPIRYWNQNIFTFTIREEFYWLKVYFKNRTESFNDYYPYNSKIIDYNNSHVYNWVELFVSMYNDNSSKEIVITVNER
jgi:hypothetical protein